MQNDIIAKHSYLRLYGRHASWIQKTGSNYSCFNMDINGNAPQARTKSINTDQTAMVY